MMGQGKGEAEEKNINNERQKKAKKKCLNILIFPNTDQLVKQTSWIFMVWDQNTMWRQYSVRHVSSQADATGANDQFILNQNLIKLVKQEDSLTGGNAELLLDMLTYSFHVICGQLVRT